MGEGLNLYCFPSVPIKLSLTAHFKAAEPQQNNSKINSLLKRIFHIRTSPILIVSTEHHFLFLKLFSFFLVATCVSRQGNTSGRVTLTCLSNSLQALSGLGTVTSLFSPMAITLLVILANRLMPSFTVISKSSQAERKYLSIL